MEKKHVDLLDRLKIVKVSSEGGPGDDEKGTKPLPQNRLPQPPPDYGYQEPKTISEGKCTLRQALEFITKYQNDPSNNKVESIAKAHNMKAADVENIINNFRIFELYVPRDKNINMTAAVMKALGTNKIKQALFAEQFENVKPDVKTTAEDKK